MAEYPLVSIITPSYNQGHFIEETIQSVLTQDYPRIEYIIMDGGSSDKTLSILKKYGNKIAWTSERDAGQTDAINKGFTKAKGDILAWLNSDDTYLPGTIKSVANYFEANPHIKVLHGKAYYTDENNSIIRPYLSDPCVKETLPEACYICQPSTFIRREVIDKVGLPDVNLHYSMDYDFIIRISKEFEIGYVDEYLSTSRLYKGTKSSDYKNMYAEAMMLQKKYFGQASFNCTYTYIRTFLQSKIKREKLVTEKPNLTVRLLAIMLSFYKFTQFNGKIPAAEFIQWLKTNRRLSCSRRL